MGQDRVEEILQRLGPLTYRQIIQTLEDEQETGNIEYSTIKALYGLRKSRRIDYTVSKEKPFRGSKPRIYRVIKEQ